MTYKKRLFFISRVLIILISISIANHAREKKDIRGNIEGVVVNITTHTPVENVEVLITETGIKDTTGKTGKFRFEKIPVGVISIQISKKEYISQIYPNIDIKSGENKKLKLELQKQNIVTLDKMVVSSSRIINKSPQQSTSVIKLTREEINNSPGSSQDINRVIQTLPSSVGTGDDTWNTFFVRGGNDHENVFMIDDIEVNNLSHWGEEYGSGGAMSFLHLDFVRNVDFYAGGFPARLPPRLSSITDIHFRDGSNTDRKFQFDLNMAGVGLFLEGPIVENKASYMVNARVSFLNLLEKLIDAGGIPKYQNGQAKIVWDVNLNNKLLLNIIAGNEIINFPTSDNSNLESAGRQLIGGLQWVNNFSIGNTDLGGRNKLLFSGIYHEYKAYELINDSIYEFNWMSTRKRFQLKDDLEFFLRENDILSIGAIFEPQIFDERIIVDEYFKVISELDSLYLGYFKTFPTHLDTSVYKIKYRNEPANEDSTLTNYRIGAYVSYTLQLGRFKINTGIRNDYYTLLREHGLSPRGSVTFNGEKKGEFSVSGGLHYQYPSYINLLELSENINKYELQRNKQVVLGYENHLSKYVILSVETYYKHYDREPLYSIRVSDSTAEREITYNNDKYGIKRGYGFEIHLQKKNRTNSITVFPIHCLVRKEDIQMGNGTQLTRI